LLNPEERLPDYTAARLPNHPVVYTFPSIGSSGMFLMPPPGELDPRPLYHIGVRMNVFNPHSFITAIHRNSETGAFVASFDAGISDDPSTLDIRGVTYPLKQVLKKNNYQDSRTGVWNWSLRERLVWQYSFDKTVSVGQWTVTCKDKAGATLYARLHLPKVGAVQPTRQVEGLRLEILPEGHRLFDDILVSMLVIERRRSATTHKFNIL